MTYRQRYLESLTLPQLLDSLERWTLIMFDVINVPQPAYDDSSGWVRETRHEIIRRCAEPGFIDGRAR